AGGRNAAGTIGPSTDFGFVVGEPMADFDLHHLRFAVGGFEHVGGVERVWRFLIIIVHEVRADGGELRGGLDAKAGAGYVDFVDCLIADVTVAGVPDPVPVVVEAILGERLHRRGAGPEVVMDAGRNRLRSGPADRGAPLVAEAASHVDIADSA